MRTRSAARRPGVGKARRSGWRGYPPRGGGAPVISLDLFAGGTFTRALEASHLTAAPTDGSTPFLAWAAAGARRIENRGDGLNEMLLMEPARTNLVIQSRNLSTWTSIGAPTLTPLQTQIDGGAAGYLVHCLSGADALSRSLTGLTVASTYSSSYWARASVAGDDIVHRVSNPDTGFGTTNGATTWERREQSFVAAVATPDVLALDARTVPGFPAADRRAIVDLAQLELSPWATSPIRTTTATVTRPADVLTYASGAYPVELIDRGFRVRYVPDYSNTEFMGLATGTNHYVIGYQSGTPGLRLRRNTSDASFTLLGTSGTVSSAAVTFAKYAVLEITCTNNMDGTWSLTIAGALTGNGTTTGTLSFSAGGTLAIGANASGASGISGRLGRFLLAL